MSQSQWVAVYLLVGFIVYITVRGQLPQFRDAIFSGKIAGGSAQDQSQPSTSTPQATTPGWVNADPSIR